MSAPFYTSKKLESDNPKWEDIDINQIIGSAKGKVCFHLISHRLLVISHLLLGLLGFIQLIKYNECNSG